MDTDLSHFCKDDPHDTLSSAGDQALPSQQFLKPALYIVATPLGNLRDITLRALDVLRAAEVIYCEDTRVTAKLLAAYGIDKKLIRCDAHTETQHIAAITAAVTTHKQIIALVSDAGTPCISDPGAALVAGVVAQSVPVVPIAGASALTAALSIAGIVQTQFTFLGFLPPRSSARRQALQPWHSFSGTLAVYESAKRVADLLTDIALILPDRDVIIARELTKRFETIYRGKPQELVAAAQGDNFKGEVVLLITPAATGGGGVVFDDAALKEKIMLQLKTKRLREAVAEVAAHTGRPRKEIYALALQVQREQEG